MHTTNTSEVARIRQQIADEYLAAARGLSGLASGTSQHAFITRRMERVGAYHDALKLLLGEPAATTVLAETLENL